MKKTRLRPLLIASVAAFTLIGAFTFREFVPVSYAAEEHGDAHGHAEGEESHDKGEEKHGHGHEEAAEEKHGEEGHSEEGHAEEGKAEEGHGEGEGEAGHGHEEKGGEAIKINESYNEEFKIRTEKAASGKLDMAVELPGEVKVNRDRTARIVARVPGVVREAPANLGDLVKAGDVLAVLESRGLAEAKAAHLAAAERLKLAKENFDRETDLKKQGVTSEQDYQNARTDHAQASIEFQNAKQGLEALGLNAEQGEKTGPKESLSRYAITAPFDGTVISKNVGIGDTLEESTEEEAFTVSDMSTLWLDIAVYQKDMNAVQAGQKVIVTPQFGNGIRSESTIAYVSPIVDEHTRTALARILLDNKEGRWRPGQFVTAHIVTAEPQAKIRVPKTALQDVDGKLSVFISTPNGYVPRAVTIGQKGEDFVEVIDGLNAGEEYVASGAFTVKAQGAKAQLDDGHAH